MSKKRIGKKGYMILGIITAVVALFFVPIVFGLISIICGIQIFRKFDERYGLFIGSLGLITLVSGTLLGAAFYSGTGAYPNTYTEGNIRVHYDNINQKHVKGLADYFSKNSSSGTDLYIKYGNGRYYVGYTTIFSSAGEIPQNYDYTFQSMANKISEEVFDGKSVVLRVLNTQGKVLKQYTS